jgi:hypothetical protein
MQSSFLHKLKIGLLLTFMAFSNHINAQEVYTTLEPNVHLNAEELTHAINPLTETLDLECYTTIFKVEIVKGNNYKKVYETNRTKLRFPITHLPVGRYMVAVHIERKIIIFNLIRGREYPSSFKRDSILGPKPIYRKSIFDKYDGVETKNDSTLHAKRKDSLYVKVENENIVEKHVAPKVYWLVYETNGRFSSSVLSKFVGIKTVKILVERNYHELRSERGKYNKLMVFEVFNVSEFIKLKKFNPKYYNIKESYYFNPTPYYSSF